MESNEPLNTTENKVRVALISSDWGQNEYRKKHNKPGAISQYRLVIPILEGLKDEYEITYWGSDFNQEMNDANTPEEFMEHFMQDYDVVISKIIDNPKAAALFRFFSERNGVKLIVDIDDNIWELTQDQPGYKEYHKGSDRLAIASTYVSLADAVFCSTEPLAKYIQNRIQKVYKEEKQTYVLPNCVNPEEWKFEKPALDPKKVVIGWAGSTTHHEDLRVAMPAIGKVLEKYPNVYFEFLGGIDRKAAMDLFKGVSQKSLERVSLHGGCPAWDQFPELLSSKKWDIAIAPLTSAVFNQSKSHIKWMEYAMCGIPCVASTVHPYMMPIQGTDTIVEGDTGFLASDDGEWYEKLSELIESSDLREEIGRNAKSYVERSWNVAEHSTKWKEAIAKVLKTEE